MMLHIFIGKSNKANGLLSLNATIAYYYFSYVQRVLIRKGAKESLLLICSSQPSNLTKGSYLVKSVKVFQQAVNGSKL